MARRTRTFSECMACPSPAKSLRDMECRLLAFLPLYMWMASSGLPKITAARRGKLLSCAGPASLWGADVRAMVMAAFRLGLRRRAEGAWVSHSWL